MTRNQFLTDANAYLEAISPNYAKSTMDEKSRKLRYYARVFYTLHLDGRIRTNAPSKLTADDLPSHLRDVQALPRGQGLHHRQGPVDHRHVPQVEG